MQPATPNVLVCIGMGSNLGNAAENCRRAVAEIGAEKNIKSVRVSPLYRTEPVGEKDQPWFVNGAASFETSMLPRDLLNLVASIERRMGRVREKKWGPRVIDLDILLYGAEVVNEEGLVIPHPRMHERRFVLLPLADICPEVVHPVLGRTVSEMLLDLKTPESVIPLGSC